MQEDLEQRTVSVSVQAAKLSGRLLRAAIAAALRKMEQECNTPKVGRNSMKRLAGRDGGSENIFTIVLFEKGDSYKCIRT